MANVSVPSTIFFATGNKKKLEEVMPAMDCQRSQHWRICDAENEAISSTITKAALLSGGCHPGMWP
jgi:inosine/xanthosine triphosphate pyrophosphatase family protein